MEISTFPMKCKKGSIFAKKLATIWLQDMGGGGLVSQDRYRLDRLALMKKFSQWRKWGFFLKNHQIKSDLNRWFEEPDLDEYQLVAVAVRAIKDWLDEPTVEFEPDKG